MNQKDQKVTYLELRNNDYSSFEIEQPVIDAPKSYKSIIHYVIMVFGFAFATILQPLILLDKGAYNISQDNIGSITSLCIVVQLITRIILAVPYGYCTERLGRKFIVFLGASSFLGSCLISSTQNTVFPGFILAQILLANSTAALSMVPFREATNESSEGKSSSNSEIVIGLSGLCACLLLKALLFAQLSLGSCYFYVSIAVFLLLIINSFGLDQIKMNDKVPSIDDISEATSTLSSNGWALIAVIIQFLGSSNFFVFFTFLALYTKSLSSDSQEEASANSFVNDLQILALFGSLLCNTIYGYFLDKQNKIVTFIIAFFALGGGAASFLMMSMSHHHSDWTLIFAVLLMGTTIPGLFVIAGYLGIKHFPSTQRKSIINFTGFLGFVGYFTVAVSGGLLYDHWRKDSPFLICAGLLAFGLVVVACVYRSKLTGKGLVI